MSNKQEFFGIFQGGGLRGLAHVAAIRVTENKLHDAGNASPAFRAVAGTSAGAIVAALIAAGYTANELYHPDHGGILDADFYTFFAQKDEWERLHRLVKDGIRLFSVSSLSQTLLRLPGFYLRHQSLLNRLFKRQGLFPTSHFSAWLEAKLQKKIREQGREPSGVDGKVAFSNLQIPLKVIATNVTERKICVYPDEDNTLPVVDAVCASIAIPFLFEPLLVQKSKMVDGGLASNFPVWVFDEERVTAIRKDNAVRLETLAFQLAGKPQIPEAGGLSTQQKGSLGKFIQDLFISALEADNFLEVRQVDDLYIVPIRTNAGLITFKTGREASEEREALYNAAKDSAYEFFNNFIRPQTAINIDYFLGTFSNEIKGLLALNPEPHLRVNVWLPIRNQRGEVIRLQIFFSHNMNGISDTDDRMTLPIGCGGVSICWQAGQERVFDLKAARKTFVQQFKMTKYEQALARHDLQSLLCIPIFKYNRIPDSSGNPLIGVLCFDSADELLDEFNSLLGNDNARATMAKWAQIIATNLQVT